MVTEIVVFLLVCMFFAAFTYGGYMAGREATERKLGEIVANQRRALAASRAANDRLTERNMRLAAYLRDARISDPGAPEWMR
jgi:hypothetical protein